MEPITLTYDVPVARAAAFYLFIGEITRWWPSLYTIDPARYQGMSIDPRVGGAVSARCAGVERRWGEVVEIDAPSRIVWSCWLRGEEANPSRVAVNFSEGEWGTRVSFEHGGWCLENAAARGRYGEWPIILAEYVAHTRRHARGASLAPRASRGVA